MENRYWRLGDAGVGWKLIWNYQYLTVVQVPSTCVSADAKAIKNFRNQ